MTRTMSAPVRSLRGSAASHPLGAGPLLDAETFAAIRQQMVLECCKWDPQVGDISTLAPFPLFVDAHDWQHLSILAERLAAELADAERELLGRLELWRMLAIPRCLRRVLAGCGNSSTGAVRVLRFDFHWTSDGWQISEVNSDVPGGYAEGSAFPRLMAQHVRDGRTAGDPAAAWADALQAAIAQRAGGVALLAAPGFMEDQQVVAFLGRILAARGLNTHLADAPALRWQNERALLRRPFGEIPLAAIVRFYQGEWLARLPRGSWEGIFTSAETLVVNPGIAILSESKRFPLTWEDLQTQLPTWRRLLPETRDPRDAPWRRDDGWLLKTALCNTGDTVAIRELLLPKRWRAVCRSVWLWPRQWVAQRRFQTLPIVTPEGEWMYPCVGVYTVNGRAAGAYARLSRGPVVDYRSIDASLLVRERGRA